MTVKYRLYRLKIDGLALLRLYGRRIKRLFLNTTLTPESCFSIPIVINNRNRYTYLRDLVDWLLASGYTSIYILDNASDYPALMDYYKHTKATVVPLGKNVGYKALWETDLFSKIKKGYYVYTDADLIPNTACPPDVLYRLYMVLKKYPVEKCGPALRISDLPDHYALKQKVLDNERPFWTDQPEKNIFLAPIDTTFALYKPFAYGNAEECSAVRVGGDLEFIHRPWYEVSKHPDPETQYYIEHANTSSVWYKQANADLTGGAEK